MEVLRVIGVYAQGHALAWISWESPGQDPDVPADDIARLRWVTGMAPRDAPACCCEPPSTIAPAAT